MTPLHGEVWLVDMGMVAKTRPAIVLMANGLTAPRSLVICIPITTQNRGSELEYPLGHLPFPDRESVANVPAIGALPSTRFEKRLGELPESNLKDIKRLVVKACAL